MEKRYQINFTARMFARSLTPSLDKHLFSSVRMQDALAKLSSSFKGMHDSTIKSADGFPKGQYVYLQVFFSPIKHSSCLSLEQRFSKNRSPAIYSRYARQFPEDEKRLSILVWGNLSLSLSSSWTPCPITK